MKIAFYSPYLPDHFGGGEKYLLDTALVYASKHDVTIAICAGRIKTDLDAIKKKYEHFLGRKLDKLHFVATPLGMKGRRLRKLWWTRGYDCLYFVTDGSAFFSLARRNIMHIQVPLTLAPRSGREKAKFKRFQVINTNSLFTKKVVEKFWQIKVDLVCQPGVDVKALQEKTVEKEKIILNVGRFFDSLHTKNQHLLVEAFRRLRDRNPQLLAGWKLVLIGSVESMDYLQKVQAIARDLPVEIITDVDRAKLLDYYARAAIYWHATGATDDENVHPEKMEHFGISTVEAMAAGCVPVVIAKGGQKEILGNKLRYLGWLTEAECLKITRKFIKSEKMRREVSLQVRERAEKFDLANFEKRCWQMLEM